MTCAASMGVAARMMSKAGSTGFTWASTDHLTEFISEDLSKKGNLVYSQGLTGSLDRLVGRARIGQYLCSGSINMHLTHDEASIWFARALGETEPDLDAIAQESLNDFGVLIDRKGDVFEYESCAISRLIMQGRASRAGGPAHNILTAEILGTDEKLDEAWPSTPADTDVEATEIQRRPLVFTDGTLTIDSVSYSFMAYALAIDNMLQPRWTNSLTPTSICPAGRAVMLRITTPFTASEVALYNGANAENIDPSTPIDASLSFTDGNSTVNITFPALQWAQRSPTVQGRGEIPLYTDFVATSTAQIAPPTTAESEIRVQITYTP